MTTKDLAKCHFCGQEISEGEKVQSEYSHRTFYICFDCASILFGVIHDALPAIFEELSNIETWGGWKERLEPWSKDKEQSPKQTP